MRKKTVAAILISCVVFVPSLSLADTVNLVCTVVSSFGRPVSPDAGASKSYFTIDYTAQAVSHKEFKGKMNNSTGDGQTVAAQIDDFVIAWKEDFTTSIPNPPPGFPSSIHTLIEYSLDRKTGKLHSDAGGPNLSDYNCERGEAQQNKF